MNKNATSATYCQMGSVIGDYSVLITGRGLTLIVGDPNSKIILFPLFRKLFSFKVLFTLLMNKMQHCGK
jgi:hypothetical protein